MLHVPCWWASGQKHSATTHSSALGSGTAKREELASHGLQVKARACYGHYNESDRPPLGGWPRQEAAYFTGGMYK